MAFLHEKIKNFKENADKKILFVLLMFMTFNSKLEAKLYYYRPSEDITLEDVNPKIDKKLKTRYEGVDGIKNQYKGKLTYLPTTVNNLKSFRKKRFYSSIYVADAIPTVNSAFIYGVNGGKTDFDILRVESSEVTFVIDTGFYNYDAMAIEMEYISTKYTINIDEKITDSTPQEVNAIILDTYAYFLNVIFESNYSSMIPFFGIGVGLLNHNINGFYFEGDSVISNFSVKTFPAYNIFVGVEFTLNDSFLFTVRYKTITSLDINIMQRNTKSDKIGFSFKSSFVGAGIKYIW
jgi:hypothetical protein